MSVGKPYFEVARLDITDREAFAPHAGQFDTVLCLNLLEHLADPQRALEHAALALAPGGKLLTLVPQGPWLRSSLDDAVGHERRFTREALAELLRRAGLQVAEVRDFNRLAVLGWLLNGRLLRRQRLDPVQLKAFNTLAPYLNLFDDAFPWPGLSLVAIGQRPGV
jgi:SAM-dependent methyltransferase